MLYEVITVAAEMVGLKLFHGSAGRMLRNTHYLGDEYYPAIIDQELFDKAEEERQSRASQLGRVRELKVKETPAVPLHFTMGKQIQEFDNPRITSYNVCYTKLLRGLFLSAND